MRGPRGGAAPPQPFAERHPGRDSDAALACPRLRGGLRARRGCLRDRHGALGRPAPRARGRDGPRHAGGQPGRQRPDPEVRRSRTRGGRFLVSRVHRCDVVVADRRRLRRSARSASRPPPAACAPHRGRGALAALPGAPGVLPAAAERGQRLGRHHAAVRIRPLHQCALAPREAPLPLAAARRDARRLQSALPSVFGGDSPRTGGRACSCATSRARRGSATCT